MALEMREEEEADKPASEGEPVAPEESGTGTRLFVGSSSMSLKTCPG